jgi:hypothetical protein
MFFSCGLGAMHDVSKEAHEVDFDPADPMLAPAAKRQKVSMEDLVVKPTDPPAIQAIFNMRRIDLKGWLRTLDEPNLKKYAQTVAKTRHSDRLSECTVNHIREVQTVQAFGPIAKLDTYTNSALKTHVCHSLRERLSQIRRSRHIPVTICSNTCRNSQKYAEFHAGRGFVTLTQSETHVCHSSRRMSVTVRDTCLSH